MNAKEHFRVNLQTAMDRAGLSQRALAELSGVHYTHINQILKGRVEPGLGLCDKLTSSLEFSVHEMTAAPELFGEALQERSKRKKPPRHERAETPMKKANELEVIEKLKLGLTQAEVGKLLGLPETTISRIAEAAMKRGLLKHPKRSHDERRAERRRIAEWVAAGHTVKEAVDRFKSNEQHVRNCCKEFDVVPKSPELRFDRRKVSQMSVIAMLIDGFDQSEVAEHFGVTRQYVSLTAVKARQTGIFDAVARAVVRALKDRGC